MRYINIRFTYLLTYLHVLAGPREHGRELNSQHVDCKPLHALLSYRECLLKGLE